MSKVAVRHERTKGSGVIKRVLGVAGSEFSVFSGNESLPLCHLTHPKDLRQCPREGVSVGIQLRPCRQRGLDRYVLLREECTSNPLS